MRREADRVNRAGAAAETSVMELVHAVMHGFRSRQYAGAQGGPRDITHMEGKVLSFFARNAGATQADLAQHSGRDKAQVARLIKRLRERGLLQGEADAADRRAVRLRLTDAGEDVQRDLRRRARALEAQALSGLGEDERRQLAAWLRRVRDNLGA